MKIIPAYAPRPVESPMKTEPSMSPRERAIARLLGNSEQGTPNSTPGVAQNNVSAEDMSAVKAPAASLEAAVAATSGQDATIETPASADSVEASQEATTTESKVDQSTSAPLSAQYAQLARKEKQIRAMNQQIKAQEAAIKAREEALAAKEAGMGSQYVPKERLTKETLAVLAEQGISYDQLTQQALEQTGAPDAQSAALIAKLEAKVLALEANQQKTTKSLEDNQKNSYDQAVNHLRSQTKQLVAADPNFETIKVSGAIEDVVDLIKQTFEDGMGDEYPKGTLLSVEEAAQMVEDHLVEEAIKIARLSKIQQRLKPATPAAGAQQSTSTQQKQPPKPTLTNAVASSRPMTARERAIAAAEGRLTKSG